MTVVVPAVFSMRSGLRGNVAVKWASLAVSRYPEAGRGEGGETACSPAVAAIHPATSTIPATIGQPAIRGGLWATPGAMSLGQGGPVAAAGSGGCLVGLAARHDHWTIGWPFISLLLLWASVLIRAAM